MAAIIGRIELIHCRSRKMFMERIHLRTPSNPCTVLFLWAALACGCGSVPAGTLGLTILDDDNTVSPDGPDVAPGPDAAPTDEVSDNAYCDAVADWQAQWSTYEQEVLDLINQERALGADCSSAGSFEPAGPLTMNAALRCAARVHSMDMAGRDYFDHYTPEGIGPGERIDDAGYSGSAWAENIAWGYATPEAVVAGWMNSDGHCANIMNPNLTETGVGYYAGSLWTQTFGRP
jgi:uncharacterized protein YkwD